MSRPSNFTKKETQMLLQTYKEHQHVIEGTFSPAVSKVKKGQAWASVLKAVNSVAVEPRSLKQVKKRFKNVKSSGKFKYQSYVKERAKTGGGPPPPPLSPTAEQIVDIYKGTPSFEGIVGGEVVSNFNGTPVDGK